MGRSFAPSLCDNNVLIRRRLLKAFYRSDDSDCSPQTSSASDQVEEAVEDSFEKWQERAQSDWKSFLCFDVEATCRGGKEFDWPNEIIVRCQLPGLPLIGAYNRSSLLSCSDGQSYPRSKSLVNTRIRQKQTVRRNADWSRLILSIPMFDPLGSRN